MSKEFSGRRILVVDDDHDVCDSVADVLAGAKLDFAHSYEAAQRKLSSEDYDAVILDIIGVKGHDLLDLYGREFPCIIFTGSAVTPESFRSAVGGHARLFLPKEEMPYLDEYVTQVLSTDRSLWPWLLKRLDFRRWFGPTFSGSSLLAGLHSQGPGPETEDQPAPASAEGGPHADEPPASGPRPRQ